VGGGKENIGDARRIALTGVNAMRSPSAGVALGAL
jgi:hypothetical protein